MWVGFRSGPGGLPPMALEAASIWREADMSLS